MSESFQMLVDQDVQIEDASDLEARVLHRYREDGLIMGEPIWEGLSLRLSYSSSTLRSAHRFCNA